jgi:hypothetical protein
MEFSSRSGVNVDDKKPGTVEAVPGGGDRLTQQLPTQNRFGAKKSKS